MLSHSFPANLFCKQQTAHFYVHQPEEKQPPWLKIIPRSSCSVLIGTQIYYEKLSSYLFFLFFLLFLILFLDFLCLGQIFNGLSLIH